MWLAAGATDCSQSVMAARPVIRTGPRPPGVPPALPNSLQNSLANCCTLGTVSLNRRRTTDRRRLRSVRAAVTIASVLTRLWPEGFDVAKCRHLFGTDRIIEGLQALQPPDEIVADWADDEAAFRRAREPYLIYA